jgi:Protein of unknown function (DUF3606)
MDYVHVVLRLLTNEAETLVNRHPDPEREVQRFLIGPADSWSDARAAAVEFNTTRVLCRPRQNIGGNLADDQPMTAYCLLAFTAEGPPLFAEEPMVIDLSQASAERRIIADEDCYDAMYWSIKFGVSVEQLIRAIAEVGPLVMNVERHLNRSTPLRADPWATRADATNVLDPWTFRTRRYG